MHRLVRALAGRLRVGVTAALAVMVVAADAGAAALGRAQAAQPGAPITNDLRAVPTLATIASPNIALGAGRLFDTAIVLGRVDPQPGATIDFALYGPDDATCAGAPLFQSVRVPYPVAGGAVSSASLVPSLPGTYRWRATYSGDANNQPVSGACNDPRENVVVRPAQAGTPRPAGRAFPLLSPFPIIRVVGRTTPRGVRIILMTVRSQVGNYVVSQCVGSAARCPYKERVALVRGRSGQVRTVHVRGFERVLRAGTVLRVYVVNAGRTGKFTSFRIASGRLPTRTDRCVVGVVLRPRPCPQD